MVLGQAFKESCPDLRNTRVIDVVEELELANTIVDVYDPWVDPLVAEQEYGVKLVVEPDPGVYDALVLTVARQCFREQGVEGVRAYGKKECILYDIKHVLPANAVDGCL